MNRKKLLCCCKGALLFGCVMEIMSFLSCSKITVAGGGADIGNPQTHAVVSGRALYPDGKIVSGANVRLRLSSFLQPVSGQNTAVHDVVTDGSGRYSIESVDTGTYFLEVNDGRSSAHLSSCTVIQNAEAVPMGTDTCRPYATVTGTVDLSVKPNAKRYVQVYGLQRLAAIDSSGIFTFDDLPGVTYNLRIVCLDPAVRAIDVPNVKAIPGVITSIPRIGVLFSKKLLLNTTASGADVSGNVYHFPILIRLTASNFDFGLARTDGADLRFSKPDNTPLPCEIERWNAVAQQGEIWVKVDTVYGNDSSHCIMMSWGNQNAAGVSNGAAVFDTGDGFQGVWHLDENGNSAAGGYADASANGYNQTGSAGMRQFADVNGVIGNAQQFSGDSTTISGPAPAKINGNESFSVSFWMNYSPASTRSWVLYFGDNAAELEMCHFLIGSTDTAQFGLSGGPSVPAASAQNVFDLSAFAGVWALVTTVYDAPAGTLATFVNGVQMDAHPVSAANIVASGGMHIGQKSANHVDETGYFGLLDELRILSTTVSSDWVKLSYMNQKAADALVKW
jgi:hypothetical protein